MENIYKIRIRSNQDPQDRYPSERRYSSSIVFGLSVMFLVLATTSTLMGTLVVKKNTTNQTEEDLIQQYNEMFLSNNYSEDDDRLLKKVEKDLSEQGQLHSINVSAVISSGTFVMAIGCFLAAITGFFASKQWYIDRNITWFFLSTCFSTVTSSISLLLTFLTVMDLNYHFPDFFFGKPVNNPPVTLSLVVNILIASFLGLVWSIIATNISFKGMKNDYPDDIIISRNMGLVQVCTVRKGNKIAKVIQPDILNHFPTTGKLAKYFPKKENTDLPKAESNHEYEERVNKFLSGQVENCEDK